jgi:tripeptidyl-peptidase-1
MEDYANLAYDSNSHYHVARYLELKGFRVHDYVQGSGIIRATAPVSLWESELNTQFYEYEPEQQELADVRIVRAESYSLPEELQNHVSYVFNIISFPLPSEVSRALIPKRSPIVGDLGEGNSKIDIAGKKFINRYVTPALLNQVYDIRNNTGSRHASQGVYETIGQTYSPSDLRVFQNYFGLPTEKVARVIGGHANNNACAKDHGNDCVEANLDIQYLMGVSQHVSTTYYYWSEEDFMLAWLNAVLKMSNPPQVLSISYGADEGYITQSYAESFNQAAIRLGLMGVTLVASSGDDGAVSTSARSNPLRCGYAPSFPASSPYVVAVGGTMGPESGNPEVACQGDQNGIITTGGGFSSLYEAPSWQRVLTEGYLQQVAGTEKAPVAGYVATGRGIPDISFLAHNYVIAVANNFTAVSGTSASSPVFAAMIGLINSARGERGLNPVGWVLPALYAFAQEYVWDVTAGHNRCAADGLVCCAQGFHATTGWDPVTGLGSLNFTTFHERMVNMGSTVPTMAPSFIAGQATPKPTGAPVARPSAHPTAAPVRSKGYIRVLEYTDTDCGGDVTTVSGAATNVCLPEYDSDGNVVGALKYTCRADGAMLTMYSASTCLDKDILDEQVFSYGCAYRVATDYYATEFYSVQVDCIEGSSSSAILNGLTGRYALQNSFDSTQGCDAGTESSALAILQGHCFALEDKGYSYRVSFPEVNYYQSLDCSGRVAQSEQLNVECGELQNNYGSGSSSSYGSGSTSWRKLARALSAANAQSASPESEEAHTFEDVQSSDHSILPPSGTLLHKKVHSKSKGDNVQDIDVEEASALAELGAQSDRSSTAGMDITSSYGSSSSSSSSSPEGTVDLFAIWSDQIVQNDNSQPSAPPLVAPTLVPTSLPSSTPTNIPSAFPTSFPTANPTVAPSTSVPTNPFSTNKPSRSPTYSRVPSESPTRTPTISPSTRTPSYQPSLAPNRVTTTMPTLVNGQETDGVVLIVMHMVSGVTKASWKACGSACVAIWLQSVRDIIPVLSAGSVEMVHVSDVQVAAEYREQTRSLRVSSFSSANTAETAPVSVTVLNITYVITAIPRQFHLSDNQAVYANLVSTLTTAVADGSFDRRVHYRAAASQVIPLLTALSESELLHLKPTTSSSSEIIHNNPSDEDSDSSSDSADSTSSYDTVKQSMGLSMVLLILLLLLSCGLGTALLCVWYKRSYHPDAGPSSLLSMLRSNRQGRKSSNNSSGKGSNKGGKGSSAYVQLPVHGGESLHGMTSFGVLRQEVEDDENDNDVEVIEFSPNKSSPSSRLSVSNAKKPVSNPMLFRASMIQHQDD